MAASQEGCPEVETETPLPGGEGIVIEVQPLWQRGAGGIGALGVPDGTTNGNLPVSSLVFSPLEFSLLLR